MNVHTYDNNFSSIAEAAEARKWNFSYALDNFSCETDKAWDGSRVMDRREFALGVKAMIVFLENSFVALFNDVGRETV